MSRENVLLFLAEHGIAYEEARHEAVFTMADTAILDGRLPGSRCKNILVRNRDGSAVFLLVTPSFATLDLGSLGRKLMVGRLSLCSPDEMLGLLGVTPGAMSPLALLADQEQRVRLLMDEELRDVRQLQFHPMDNTATVVIEMEGFLRFVDCVGHTVEFVDLPFQGLKSSSLAT